jgi:hypothetical protein
LLQRNATLKHISQARKEIDELAEFDLALFWKTPFLT